MQAGANVDVKRIDGRIALHEAAGKGFKEIVKMLVIESANLDL
jgi:ankyrin repeat protein